AHLLRRGSSVDLLQRSDDLLFGESALASHTSSIGGLTLQLVQFSGGTSGASARTPKRGWHPSASRQPPVLAQRSVRGPARCRSKQSGDTCTGTGSPPGALARVRRVRSFSVPFPSRRALSASLLLTVIVAGCQRGTPAVDELGDPLESLPEGAVALQFGDDVDPSTQQRVELLVRQVSAPRAVTVLPADAAPSDGQAALVLSFGRTASTEALIGNLDRELEKLGSEGFLVRSGSLGGAKAFAAVGNAMEGDTRPARIGTGFASYALLEELGFGFLHPLEPTLPSTL